MEKIKRHRNVLWFFMAGIWFLQFSLNLLYRKSCDLLSILQLLNAIAAAAVGIVETANCRMESRNQE